MILDIDKYLAIPSIAYAPSDASIWTDNHISAQMLAAHLDAGFEGASRKHTFIDKSVAWITKLMPPAENPALLDIGCGPGLYAERFARKGYKVTGIDFSERSIQYASDLAQRKGLAAEYLCQDYLKLQLDQTFPLATFIYCDYGALSDSSRKLILRNIYKQLHIGGKLLLDVFSMRQYEQFQDAQTWEECPDGGFWSASRYFAINRSVRYAYNLTLRQTTIVTEAETRCFNLWDTYFSEENLAMELCAAGFEISGVYGDVAGAPYTDESTTIAILATKVE